MADLAASTLKRWTTIWLVVLFTPCISGWVFPVKCKGGTPMVLHGRKKTKHSGGFGPQKKSPVWKKTLKTSPGLVQVSINPLIFTMDDFLDETSCKIAQTSEEVQLDFLQRVATLLFEGQAGRRDGLRYNYACSSKEDSSTTSDTSMYPDGMHMDTNNECIFRHVTAILYLNTVSADCGGATVFPLGRCLEDNRALAASKRLLGEKISHTQSCGLVRRSGVRRQADAKLLESRGSSSSRGASGDNDKQDPETDTVVKIQPKQGRLCIFFSRTDDGQEDPYAWHAGEGLRQARDGTVTEKKILTLFKEVDYRTPTMVATTFEDYLAPQCRQQRQSLVSQAQGL